MIIVFEDCVLSSEFQEEKVEDLIRLNKLVERGKRDSSTKRSIIVPEISEYI